MSCDEFEQLYAEANGACQICEVPGRLSTHGILVIDHDNAIGFEAVRGLLCSTCNTFLGRSGHLDAKAVLRYVQNAWHLTNRRGLVPPQIVIPDVPREQVPALLSAAAEQCQDAAGRALLRPEERRPLVDAIRIAAKAGMRQRDIVQVIGRLWNREAVYNALHVNGCKVAGKIRTRDDDLVRAAAASTSEIWENWPNNGWEFHCRHPRLGVPGGCGEFIFAGGKYPDAVRAAIAAGWAFSQDCALCEEHADHLDCVHLCVYAPVPPGPYAQLPLFAA